MKDSLTRLRLIASLFFVCSLSASRGILGFDRQDVPAPPPDNVCGVNCLYMFLKTIGVSVSEKEIMESTPRSVEGTSLLGLQKTARHFGVETGIYHCEISDLDSIWLPAIILFQTTPRATGHYGLLYSVEPGAEGRLRWIEGNVGYDYSCTKEEFAKRLWSGYLISRPPPPGLPIFAIGLTAAHSVGWLNFLFFRSRKRAENPRN